MGLLSFSTVVMLAASSPVIAQDSRAPAPADIRFELSCPASPCRFRQGETIPVELSFSTDAAGYGVLNLLNGYTGRFEFFAELDSFKAEPSEGVIDPVGDASTVGGAGSWNPSLDPLSGRGAAKIWLELNQWLFFEKPGLYRVTAMSRGACAIDGSDPIPIWRQAHCVDARSNPIDVEIVAAEPEWQRQELERIVRGLPDTLMPLTRIQKAAVRALTYLGTDEALGEIQKHLAAGGPAMDLTWFLAKRFLLLRMGHTPDQ